MSIAPAIAVLHAEPEKRKALRRLLAARGYCVEEYEGGEALLTEDVPGGVRGRLMQAAIDEKAGGRAGATDEAAMKAELVKKTLNR